jgi:hypothetical protein
MNTSVTSKYWVPTYIHTGYSTIINHTIPKPKSVGSLGFTVLQTPNFTKKTDYKANYFMAYKMDKRKSGKYIFCFLYFVVLSTINTL